MIEKSLLNKKKIVKLLKENYDLNVYSSRKINRGSANIYKIIDEKNNIYILKEFQLKYNKQDIDKEISIIRFLEERNIKVPKYIKLLNGDYSFVYEGHVIVLQQFIEGYSIPKNKGNMEQSIESATYLGKIVKELENYPHEVNFKKDSWFNLNFDDSIEKYKKLIDKVKDDKYKERIISDLNEKIDMLTELKEINFDNIDKVSIKFTHGDYSVMQFIYLNNKVNSIIDFVSACDMPIIWEIIRSYSYIYYKNKNGKFDIEGFIPYVKEYLKYSKLNKYDLEYMPYIYLIQLLNSSFGYKQYIDSGNLELLKFAFYRTNICRYLFINSKKLSEILLKEVKL